MMIEGPTIRTVLARVHQLMERAPIVSTERWQAQDVKNNPAAKTHELTWLHLHFPLMTESLDFYASALSPDLPWADNHFEERISGIPYNPQPSEATWPHGDGTNQTFREGDHHTHTYSERFWPRYAPAGRVESNHGIRYRYGDLSDLIDQMHYEPFNRQGILPIFFPEDTGYAHTGRKPCTLHYHFMRRDHYMDMEYSIRSCDYHRHFRNDIYLAIRLLLWMLGELRILDPQSWGRVKPRKLIMNVGSLHLFRNDYISLYGKGGAA